MEGAGYGYCRLFSMARTRACLYFFIASARRDFFRFAVARARTPDLTALSKAEWTPDKALEASSFLPPVTSVRNSFSNRRNFDFTARLCKCLRSLLRIRRSADFVFGIIIFVLSKGVKSYRDSAICQIEIALNPRAHQYGPVSRPIPMARANREHGWFAPPAHVATSCVAGAFSGYRKRNL